MRSILSSEIPIVVNIRTVTRNNMKNGHYPRRPAGRYSDCLVYIVSGEAHYSFDGYNLDVKSDSILYLAYDCLYTIDVMSDMLDVIFVDFDFLYNCNSRYKCEAAGNASVQTKACFENMYKTWLTKKTGYLQKSVASIYAILADVLVLKEGRYHSSRAYSVISAAVEYINESFCDSKLSIESASAVSGITRTHFGRVFRELYNMTPKRYIEQLRFERARELMESGEFSISEIAEMCGFSDVYYFSRAFKLEFGISPRGYMLEKRNTR